MTLDPAVLQLALDAGDTVIVASLKNDNDFDEAAHLGMAEAVRHYVENASPWRAIETVPDDDQRWIIVRTSQLSVSPGHVILIRRGMLSDRLGPNHLRIFADLWFDGVMPPEFEGGNYR